MNKFNTFPTGKERKKTIEKNRQATTEFKNEGRRGVIDRYSWRDSPIGEDEDEYFYKGKPFDRSFQSGLTEGKRLKAYIETVLESRKGKAIGVEFGGVGSNLFSGFTPRFFLKSVGVTLIDHRDPEDDLIEARRQDIKINHQLLEGDIFDSETYEFLDKILNKEKVDLILERMAGGLEYVPVEPYTVSRILQIWYNLLSGGGVMFVQTPIVFNNLVRQWVAKIKKEFKGVIDIEYQEGDVDGNTNCSAFRLLKLPGAPTELPLLDPRTVKKTGRNGYNYDNY